MATVNKSSLRAEFDALKARFESLCAAGKMSAESRALFDALLMLFELLMAVFMEKHTPKSSANSSLPASQSPNDDTARTRPGAKGKGPHPTVSAAPTPAPAPANTSRCSASMRAGAVAKTSPTPPAQAASGAPSIDIVFEKVVRHADAQIKQLPALPRRDARMLPPPDARTAGSTAPASKPTSCTCSSRRCSRSSVSPNRCTPSSGAPSPRATLLGYVAQLHHALAEWEHHAIERLLAMPAMHVDETSLRVDRKNHWIHV